MPSNVGAHKRTILVLSFKMLPPGGDSAVDFELAGDVVVSLYCMKACCHKIEIFQK
jgi:hypothetical protein